MYEFLYQLTKEQLNNLLNCTTDNNLKIAIKKVLINKGDIDENYRMFLSERSTYETDDLLSRYNDISNSLNINSLDFLTKMAYCEKGNNIGPSCNRHYLDTAGILFTNEEIRKILASYDVNDVFKLDHIIYYHKYRANMEVMNDTYSEIMNREEIKEELEKLRYFSYLDNFFKNEDNIRKYEGTFNTYMYIREFIFSQLSSSETFNKDTIFDDFDLKVELVVENFRDICSYLYNVRESIKGLRLSIGNTKIAYNSRKCDKDFTEYQRTFINGLAFGTTLEKLDNGDYTDLTILIYLPKNKIYQLENK